MNMADRAWHDAFSMGGTQDKYIMAVTIYIKTACWLSNQLATPVIAQRDEAKQSPYPQVVGSHCSPQ